MSTGFNTSLRYFIALGILALLTMPVSRAQPDNIVYSVFVTPGQDTYIQSSNGNFGTLLTGYSRTLSNSIILNNTGAVAAKVEARFVESVNGVYGIINGTNVLNATNFAMGNSTLWVPLNNTGADVQVAVAYPGLTALSARLSVPVEQAVGIYNGTVILIFSNI